MSSKPQGRLIRNMNPFRYHPTNCHWTTQRRICVNYKCYESGSNPTQRAKNIPFLVTQYKHPWPGLVLSGARVHLKLGGGCHQLQLIPWGGSQAFPTSSQGLYMG